MPWCKIRHNIWLRITSIQIVLLRFSTLVENSTDLLPARSNSSRIEEEEEGAQQAEEIGRVRLMCYQDPRPLMRAFDSRRFYIDTGCHLLSCWRLCNPKENPLKARCPSQVETEAADANESE
ncbi:hypothetical protein TSAR_004911 [Trichomalopsis sarcophagae]|uniref:Uncharacterized protein n=1 Tax=Trichomalopsis sarcophagae TaxID=543379 RepID=A0A232EQ80_9HYME|nr:hypothetical protein TSAR_004911 [Trichomalopsis sarcophagae]